MNELFKALFKEHGIEVNEDQLQKYVNDFLSIVGLSLIGECEQKLTDGDWEGITKCLKGKDNAGLLGILESKFTPTELSELVQTKFESVLNDYIQKVVQAQ